MHKRSSSLQNSKPNLWRTAFGHVDVKSWLLLALSICAALLALTPLWGVGLVGVVACTAVTLAVSARRTPAFSWVLIGVELIAFFLAMLHGPATLSGRIFYF
ncbi:MULTISPECIES: hypothetical protein [unclassified Leifsonia]|uniref:hypothetical protein n=1 Tax=unclassified Leifsonia TaxID=2663824 RepID=UPI0008A72312|nr:MULTISPECIES: hypothetical protein [unclassified Leifsonia]SEI00763.1 hypothetical protein SAMN04515694_109130 [Leifsonia sp. CL154]SFL65980.1 hypothetical protein SAMN04515692_1094 [Leifsonia sp. CL147]